VATGLAAGGLTAGIGCAAFASGKSTLIGCGSDAQPLLITAKKHVKPNKNKRWQLYFLYKTQNFMMHPLAYSCPSFCSI
jgi:hypothetical protein